MASKEAMWTDQAIRQLLRQVCLMKSHLQNTRQTVGQTISRLEHWVLLSSEPLEFNDFECRFEYSFVMFCIVLPSNVL